MPKNEASEEKKVNAAVTNFARSENLSDKNRLSRIVLSLMIFFCVLYLCDNQTKLVDAQGDTWNLSEEEMRQFIESAKIALYLDLGDEGYALGHGGFVIDQNDVVRLCTINHVANPYELRVDSQNGDVLIDGSHFVQWNYPSASGPESAVIKIGSTLFEPTMKDIEEGDPTVCAVINGGIRDILEGRKNLHPENLPELRPFKIAVGEQLVIVGMDRQLHYFEIVEINGDLVTLKDNTGEELIGEGDSGSLAYIQQDGQLVAVGAYQGRTILPSKEGPKTLHRVIMFDSE